MAYLGEFEQLVLLAVMRLDDDAFGPQIARELDKTAGRPVTRGALYSALNRLEEKGFLNWTPAAAGADRGGHARRLYVLQPAGLEALRDTRASLLALWAGHEKTLGGGKR